LDFHGLLKSRPFITPFQPYGAYYAMVFVSLLAITNGYTVFFPGSFTASDFLVSYIVFVIFFVLYFGHKLYYKTPWMIKVSELDIFSGKDEIDRLEEEEIEPQPRNWLERVWWWIA
jgi:amino acid transporter